MGFFCFKKLCHTSASSCFHKEEIHYIEDSVVLRVFCPLQLISTPIFTALPCAEFPYPVACVTRPLDLKSDPSRVSLGMVSLFAQPQRLYNTHHDSELPRVPKLLGCPVLCLCVEENLQMGSPGEASLLSLPHPQPRGSIF